MRCFADAGTRAEVAIRFVGTLAACGTRPPPEGDVLVPWLAASAVALALRHEDLNAHPEIEAYEGLAAFHAVALPEVAGAVAVGNKERVKQPGRVSSRESLVFLQDVRGVAAAAEVVLSR